MTTSSIGSKSMTIGEAVLAPLFTVFAFLCMVGAALAHDAAFAFHASLGCVASLLAAFTILNRYYDRPAELPPQEINGRPNYNLGPIKFASVAAVFWGIAGFTVGLIIASQLAWPGLNLDLPWTTFGRLRPLHTSAVVFAFGGNVLIATSFYVVQKTCRVRIAGDLAPWFVVLGYNFFILIAGTGYLLGVTQSKEYAEPEWACRGLQRARRAGRSRGTGDPADCGSRDVRLLVAGHAQCAAGTGSQEGDSLMEVLVFLVPLAITLGFVGLMGFLWSVKSGQYDDLDGAAWRAIADDEPAGSSNGRQDP